MTLKHQGLDTGQGVTEVNTDYVQDGDHPRRFLYPEGKRDRRSDPKQKRDLPRPVVVELRLNVFEMTSVLVDF